MQRVDKRKVDELRELKIQRNYLKDPQGSVLIEMGNTKVICTAFVEKTVPPFLKDTGKGWITAEYSMLPGSTHTRKRRDRDGKIDGRSQEIQRLIGRSLRSVVDLNKLGEVTIKLDCDVIQADGGTRTASINGAFIALYDAIEWLRKDGSLTESPIRNFISAISVGVVQDTAVLDLPYIEDSNASVDMNVVMSEDGKIIEIQGTGEENPFTSEQLFELLALAKKGCLEISEFQKNILGV
jgi:ribonuclease PH